MSAALEKVAKWRAVFAGWQLGTRPKGDPESDAVRDHREATILLRVEMTALASLLVKKGLITVEEFTEAMDAEAQLLDQDYQRFFPGMRATVYGMQFDQRAAETMKSWRP